MLGERSPPDLHDIIDASRRISGVASRTPLIESPALSKRFGREVYLKLECFQPIRVFKIRGAYNKVSRVSSVSVVAASSGNHGIAVAYSARLLGKKCTVVVPETAVAEKVKVIAELGAKVVKYGRFSDEREAKAKEIASHGNAFVHPFDDPDVIAGQGTCGLEMVEQLSEFDSVVVPVGGGGLISGISIAVKSSRPSVKVFGVEPAGAAKLSASLGAGRRVSIEAPKSIADGLLPNSVGQIAFEVCRKNVDGTFKVTEEQIMEAMRLMISEAHVIPEPSGAAPLAALLTKRNVSRLGRRVVLVVSGGNVSLDLLRRVLERI